MEILRGEKMKKLICSLAILMSMSAIATPEGSQKYAQCIGCHGVQAEGGIGPRLNDKDAEYISSRLKAYRNKETVGAQSALMWGIAGNLSDDDIEDLAEYVSRSGQR